jgi:hypothetical protein|tara:strand:- start:1059 stop:1196 length:138 start_codon:yes stop_codon:yes gene_type:complete
MDSNMKKNEFVVLSVWIIFLIIILCIVTIATGCDSGWSVAGWEIK